jgi:pimeloyl-ACP methyl ester carboxylesterase
MAITRVGARVIFLKLEMKGILMLVLALVTTALLRADVATIVAAKVPDVVKANIHYETSLPPTNGVLVLLPGMNGDGRLLMREKAWQVFAQDNGLGLSSVSFISSPSLLYGYPAKGYYYPEHGSGDALLNALRRVYGKHVPILLYGFSGGAQFGSRFVQLYPDNVLGWAAYSASFWPAPVLADQITAPGIIACGELDADRYGPSFDYFQKGRRKHARWTWVSLYNVGHARNEQFEDFVRTYFDALLSRNFDRAEWRDNFTKQSVSQDARLLNPALSVWLPTPEVAERWLKIHHP